MFEKNKTSKLAKYQIRAPEAGVGLMRWLGERRSFDVKQSYINTKTINSNLQKWRDVFPTIIRKITSKPFGTQQTKITKIPSYARTT